MKPARSKGRMPNRDREIIKRANFLRRLLKEFDAKLSGFDPGVLMYIPDGFGKFVHSVQFDGLQWSWIEPLLIELCELRKGAKGPKPGRGSD